MKMYKKLTSPLLVIIAGLLSCIANADAQNSRTYTLCQLSTPTVLTVTPASQPFIIQSPNYTYGSYPNNVDCTLTIASGAEPLVLSFEYRVFNLEVATNCAYDYLCVSGVKFCGNWSTGRTFQKILPPRSNSTVYFHTDSSVTLNGFYVIVTSQTVHQIQQVIGSGWSELNISYVPETYYPGMPYTDGCRPNTVVPTNAYTRTVAYTRTSITTQDTRSSTQETPAEDTTIATTQQDTYYLCNNQQSTKYIDINSRSSPFLIRSPNYGRSQYSNGLYCSLVIRSGAEPLVLSLRIKDFQLEHHPSCVYDYLCVHGTKFCGEWLSGYKFQYIVPENSHFTAIFRTDGSGTLRGFDIEISQELARTNQAVLQPTGEVASSNDTFSNTLETYYPWYPYIDRCAATSTAVPPTSQTRVSTAFPASTRAPPTSQTRVSTTFPASTRAPPTSYFGYSTTSPPSNGYVCYSAAQAQQLNEIIDNAITNLNAARRLLLPRK